MIAPDDAASLRPRSVVSEPSIALVEAEFAVVDKPSGWVVHRGFSADERPLDRWLAGALGQAVFPVHRLDRGTSGLVLFARTKEAARELGACFAEGRVDKSYVALVRGAFPLGRTRVEHAIPKDEGGPRVPAATTFEGLATISCEGSPLREKRYSWIAAKPETGRFHQIRRHAKHLHHPLIGDTTYGRTEHNRFLAEAIGLTRLALHAGALAFPWRGSVVEVRCALPMDLVGPLRALGWVDLGDGEGPGAGRPPSGADRP